MQNPFAKFQFFWGKVPKMNPQWLEIQKLILKNGRKDLLDKFDIRTFVKFLFSAHIQNGKGKYLNQSVFFHNICPPPKLYSN